MSFSKFHSECISVVQARSKKAKVTVASNTVSSSREAGEQLEMLLELNLKNKMQAQVALTEKQQNELENLKA